MSTVDQLERELVRTISKALSASGVSRRAAAARTGVSLSTLNRRFRGESPFFLDELFSLAEILGVTLSSLVQDTEVWRARTHKGTRLEA